jgi:hypothetical protein
MSFAIPVSTHGLDTKQTDLHFGTDTVRRVDGACQNKFLA